MSLHDLARDDDQAVNTAPLTGSCAWGIVTWTSGSQLRCSLDTFDAGTTYDFGPVTCADLTGTGIHIGDRVLLLALADGDEPAAALKFPQ